MIEPHDRVLRTCLLLLQRARACAFKGFDPYDALNASHLNQAGLLQGRLPQLIATQLLKHLPFDTRRLLRVPPHRNPKALALFLDGSIELHGCSALVEESTCRALCADLARSSRGGYSGSCWGYPFPWQARAFFLPAHTPTVVCTAYVGQALVNASHMLKDSGLLEQARSACDFILQDLRRTETAEGICFSYSPLDQAVVHNASLLGARLLASVGDATGDSSLIEIALSAASFTVAHQRADGAWAYGSAGHQQWVDHFHTGFILECLHDIHRMTGEAWVRSAFARGLSYYIEHLFLECGAPKYYERRAYPLDAHSYGQAILTLLRSRMPVRARRVAIQATRDLWHPQGYFCYQRTRYYRNQINYFRWSQAWMFRGFAALASYQLRDTQGQGNREAL